MAALDILPVDAAAWVAPASGTTIAPAYPAGIQAGDRLYAIIVTKLDTVTIATPANWTALFTSGSLGSGTAVAGTGPFKIFVFGRTATATLTGTQSFAISGGGSTTNSPVAHIRAIRAEGTGITWSEAFATYTQTTARTAINNTTSTGIAIQAKDRALWVHGNSDDLATVTFDLISQTGTTFTAAIDDPPGTISNGQGNDISAAARSYTVSSGGGTGTVTVTGTIATSETFGGLIFRVRADGTPLPAAPDIATLTDTFDAVDTGKWTYAPNVTVAGGQATLGVSATTQGLTASTAYNLVGSAIQMEVAQLPNLGAGSTNLELTLVSSSDANAFARLVWENDTIYAQYRIGTAGARTNVLNGAIASGANTRWWRISESGGIVTWSLSPDSTTWTTLGTPTNVGFPLTRVIPSILTGYWGTETTPGTAIVDNVNPSAGVSENRTPADTAAAVDTAAAGLDMPRTPADSAAATDAVNVTVARAQAAADASAALDTVSTAGSFAVSVTDAAAAGDTAATARSVSVTVTDTLATTDTTAVTIAGTFTAGDIAAAVDTPVTTSVYAPVVTDTAAGTDTPQATADLSRTATDTAAVIAATAPALAAARAADDTASATETISPAVAAPRAAADSAAAVDVLTLDWSLPVTTGLLVTPVSPGQLDLSWTSVSGATGYDIERDGVVIATDHPTVSYSDTAIVPETTYGYRVRAVIA